MGIQIRLCLSIIKNKEMDEPNGVTLQALTSLPVQTKGERPIRWAIGNYQLPFECQARQLSKRLMDFQKLKRIANLNFTKTRLYKMSYKVDQHLKSAFHPSCAEKQKTKS